MKQTPVTVSDEEETVGDGLIMRHRPTIPNPEHLICMILSFREFCFFQLPGLEAEAKHQNKNINFRKAVVSDEQTLSHRMYSSECITWIRLRQLHQSRVTLSLAEEIKMKYLSECDLVCSHSNGDWQRRVVMREGVPARSVLLRHARQRHLFDLPHFGGRNWLACRMCESQSNSFLPKP